MKIKQKNIKRVLPAILWSLALACSSSGGGSNDDDDMDCGDCQVLVSGSCQPDPTCNCEGGVVPECLSCQTFNADACACEGPSPCPCELECESCQEAVPNGDGCECVMKADSKCGNGVVDFGEKCDPPGSAVPNGGCGICCDNFVCEGDCYFYNGSRCIRDVNNPDCVVCGNGTKEGEECCDDGNGNSCDGCSPGCSCETPQGNCPCPLEGCDENQYMIYPDNDLCECVDKPCGGLECEDPTPYLDEENCRCVKTLCEMECAGLKVPNPLCTQCVCPSVTCDGGLLRDPDTCECVADTCAEADSCEAPFVRTADCRCTCDPFQVACSNPYVVDVRSCACDCGLYCGTNQRVDTAACECVPVTCGNGVVEGNEVCDSGENNGRGPGYCNTRCTSVVVCVPPTGFTVDLGGTDYLPDCPQ